MGGTKNISMKEWESQINIAEKLLIFHCSPPYNTTNLNSYGDIKNTLILNFDKKNRLHLEVSTFWEDSDF